jgi:phosphonate transport system permease protein
VTEAAFAYLRDAILQTVGITCGALALALAFGIPLALVIVRGGFIGASISACVSVVRAIPDLVLAIVAVVALGLGPLPGVVALGVHYAAVIAKLFADVLGSVRREAAEALRATGATSNAAFLVGMVPAAWPGIVGFSAYAFESIVRAAVIVGVVGAGGMGALLIQQLNLADYRGFGQSLAVLIALIIVVDIVSERLRLRARPVVVLAVGGGIVIVGIVAFACTADPPWDSVVQAPQHLVAFIRSALPLDWSPTVIATAANGALVSLAVAAFGTIAGLVLALPLAWLAASDARSRATLRRSGAGDRAFSFVSRALLVVVRAFPPIALGLLGLSIVGLGPPAAMFALTLHTASVLGKLLAESLELADRGPAEALAATGATPAAAVLISLLPASASVMLAHVLYRFEWNVRASTVLGLIGAGGLGQAIFNAQQLLFYRQLASYVLVAIALVIAIDLLGARVRARFHLGTMAA